MKQNIYFDNAATTWPKPEPVYLFMDSFYRSSGVNPGRGSHGMAAEAEAMTHATRQMLATFFGFSGDTNRVIFTLNATDSLNMAVASLTNAGDHVVTTRIEHNAVLRISNHLERDAAVEFTRIAVDESGYIDANDIERAIKKNTKVIVLNHASNVLGTVQPLEDVAKIAKKHGLLLVVDTAQTAGVLPIDMDELGIDVLTFTGHKGLFGPMGVGGLIVAEHVELDPQRVGGTGVNSKDTYQPESYPYKLEAGTAPLPGIAGLHAAQLWFKELGQAQQKTNNLAPSDQHQVLCQYAMAHIHNTEMQHLNTIESWLQSYSHVRILGKPRSEARVASLSFASTLMPASQIGDMLDADHQICVRAGLHCAPLVHVDAGTADSGGAVRVSPGYFTDDEDMQRLKAGFDDILSDS